MLVSFIGKNLEVKRIFLKALKRFLIYFHPEKIQNSRIRNVTKKDGLIIIEIYRFFYEKHLKP